MNLIEKYQNRLSVSEKYFASNNNGRRLDSVRKAATAQCLENISKFMNESFDAGQATQQSNLGNWKRFCLNLTTVAVPNCIAPDLVMVQPMSSIYGYVTFTDFVSGDDKGGVKQDDLFNGLYGLGKMDANRVNYTGAQVVETVKEAGKVAWMQNGKFGQFGRLTTSETEEIKFHEGYVLKSTDAATKKLTAVADVVVNDNVSYIYDNVIIPQAKLPHLKAIQRNIPLEARCRRIAITYSQIAQFQAKTDYGYDLGQQLSAQAAGELQYEIDSEVVKLLDDSCDDHESGILKFSRLQPVGVSLRDHYEAFARVLAQASAIIYGRTQKYQPNYMICAADCLDVLSMNTQFKSAPTGTVYGPYFAGTFGALKVYVSPMMAKGEFVIGVNGGDLKTSAAVYAPYMPVIPTQLLGMPDGTMTQGFATMYDLKLLARGEFDANGNYTPNYEAGTKSPLLIKGKITD